MSIVLNREPNRSQVSFRLRDDVMERIKIKAGLENRSVSNYIETLLLDDVYYTPNEDTLEAIREAKEKSADEMETLPFDSVEEFLEYVDRL